MEEQGKRLGLWNLVGFSLGSAIGTGIFVLLGFAIANTGRSVVLAVISASVFMMMTGWAKLVMSSMFVFKGGEYGMCAMLFPPIVTGMKCWFTVLGALGFSSMSVSFTSYLCVVFPQMQPYSTLIAFLYTVIVFAVTIKGSRFLTVVENIITVILVVALATFILFGVFHVDFGNFFSATYDGGFFHDGAGGFLTGISTISYACMGAYASLSLATVSENPKKTVPMSVLIVTIILAGIYGLMALVASGVLPYDMVAGQNISVTAQEIFPTPLFVFFVSGGGLCAIASSSLSTLGNMRYPLINIANDGWLPAIFKRTTKSGYPYVSFLLYFICAVLPLAMELPLNTIVSLVNVPMQILNIFMSVYVITLPKKYPAQWEHRSIRIPLPVYYVGCALGILCSGIITVMLFNNMEFNAKILSAISVAALVVLSWLRIKQGAVDVNKLESNKKQIIAEAIAASDAAN